MEIILIYTIFAVKDLGDQAKSVYDALNKSDIEEARKKIAMLVSRDVKNLDAGEIARAAVETVSENIVDGIISPMFFLFLGGAPLGMAYKAASTLDSMVGYKNDKYIKFGWASARLDDILNFIPARIAGFFLIPLASLICGYNPLNSLAAVKRDRLNHASPNSGHSEAAVAGALKCRLGGPSIYFGQIVNKPLICTSGRDPGKEDILKSIKIMYVTSIVSIVIGSALTLIAGYLFSLI